MYTISSHSLQDKLLIPILSCLLDELNFQFLFRMTECKPQLRLTIIPHISLLQSEVHIFANECFTILY